MGANITVFNVTCRLINGHNINLGVVYQALQTVCANCVCVISVWLLACLVSWSCTCLYLLLVNIAGCIVDVGNVSACCRC